MGGVGLWWAATTVTTVGYGDVVPTSPAGRLVGAALMFIGIASRALLTAIAASAIVVGEVRSGERVLDERKYGAEGTLHPRQYPAGRREDG